MLLIQIKTALKKYNFCESKDKKDIWTCCIDYNAQLSLSTADTINNFLSIIAILSLAITTSSAKPFNLQYIYGQRIWFFMESFFIESLYIYIVQI